MEKGLYYGIVKGQRFDKTHNDKDLFAVSFEPVEYLRKEDKTTVPVQNPPLVEATVWFTEAARKITEDRLKILCGDDWPAVAANPMRLEPSYPDCVDLKGRRALFINEGPLPGKTYDQWAIFVPGSGRKRTSDPEVAQRLVGFFSGSAPKQEVSDKEVQDLYNDMNI